MSLTPHTAGTWFVTHDAQHPAELAIDTVVDGRTVHIALVHGVGTDEETGANAALIAAAPVLLEALKEMGDWLAYGLSKPDGAEPTDGDLERCERIAAKASAAIAKAMGSK